MFEKLRQKLKQIKERITDVAPESTTEESLKIVGKGKPEVLPVTLEERDVTTHPEKVSERKESPGGSFKEIIRENQKPDTAPEKPKPPHKVLTAEKPKKGLIRAVKRVVGRELTSNDIDDIIWDLQVAILESDVAIPVADNIVEQIKNGLVGKKVGLRADVKKMGGEILRDAIRNVLTSDQKVDLFKIIEGKRVNGEPAVFVFVGINGHGKTTTIAKFSHYLSKQGYKVVLAAGDTFRAAGIEQLEIHANNLGVDIIKQKRGSDAAAVAYDAISHAKARRIDVVLVDTAGRMQTDINLMDEMKKIVRVAKPDAVIFVGDALTGNDAVEQAKTFDQAVHITGSILCKMDADARGGAALSIAHVTGKPIIFLGTGQGYDDLVEFNPDIILNALFAD